MARCRAAGPGREPRPWPDCGRLPGLPPNRPSPDRARRSRWTPRAHRLGGLDPSWRPGGQPRSSRVPRTRSRSARPTEVAGVAARHRPRDHDGGRAESESDRECLREYPNGRHVGNLSTRCDAGPLWPARPLWAESLVPAAMPPSGSVPSVNPMTFSDREGGWGHERHTEPHCCGGRRVECCPGRLLHRTNSTDEQGWWVRARRSRCGSGPTMPGAAQRQPDRRVRPAHGRTLRRLRTDRAGLARRRGEPNGLGSEGGPEGGQR